MSKEFDAMMRLESEDRIPLKKAKPLFEGEPSIRTLQRWILRGLYQPILADRVFLEGYRGQGRSWVTSRQACRRFVERMNGDRE